MVDLTHIAPGALYFDGGNSIDVSGQDGTLKISAAQAAALQGHGQTITGEGTVEITGPIEADQNIDLTTLVSSTNQLFLHKAANNFEPIVMSGGSLRL